MSSPEQFFFVSKLVCEQRFKKKKVPFIHLCVELCVHSSPALDIHDVAAAAGETGQDSKRQTHTDEYLYMYK